MKKIVKIYCNKKELAQTAPKARLIESYDAFQVAELASGEIPKVNKVVPVEDISDQYQLTVAGRKVDTSKRRYDRGGKPIKHPAYAGARPLERAPHHYLVQFIGPIKGAWLRQVEKAGAKPRGPYGGFTYIFLMGQGALVKVSKMPVVRWVGHLPYSSRIAAGVLAASQTLPEPAEDFPLPLASAAVRRDTIAVQFFSRENQKAAIREIETAGGQVLNKDDQSGLLVVGLPANTALRRDLIHLISEIHGVRLITNKTVRTTRNNVAVGFMGTAKTIPPPPVGLGLTGKGEIIGIADTGIDTGVASTVLPDFHGRIKAIHSWPVASSFAQDVTNVGADDGPSDVDSGHGTHVSGSAVGAGSPGGGNSSAIKGLSNGAKLVFQAIEQKLDFVSPQVRHEYGDTDYALAGLPDDLNQLFQQAYDAGVRVHSNSWGGGKPQEYADDSRQVDEFIWNHPDFCILIAAGNDGADPNPGADGVVNLGSITPPATAKNCITVGASESVRAVFANLTYGAGWPTDYPKNPLKSDPVANDSNQMAAFSSRGPTDDGRFKPDVVAPGTAILSTRSTRIPAAEQGWGAYAANGHYMYDGGTSMATPLTAGAAGVIRQYLRTVKKVAKPSAALLKAVMICGAQRLPLPYVSGSPVADNHQGFGRVNLDAVLAPAGSVLGLADVTPGLKTGALNETSVTIGQNHGLLRVVLAYSDYPGHGLKNNLNLLLISPSGTRFAGNSTGGGTLKFDAKNNVEVINIPNPAAGVWRLQVIAANVPQGPQPFALAWLAPH